MRGREAEIALGASALIFAEHQLVAVDLTRLPAHVTAVVFVVTSYAGHTFERVRNAFWRLVDDATNTELARAKLRVGGAHTGMVVAKVRRAEGIWQFQALGAPIRAGHPVEAATQLDPIPLTATTVRDGSGVGPVAAGLWPGGRFDQAVCGMGEDVGGRPRALVQIPSARPAQSFHSTSSRNRKPRYTATDTAGGLLAVGVADDDQGHGPVGGYGVLGVGQGDLAGTHQRVQRVLDSVFRIVRPRTRLVIG